MRRLSPRQVRRYTALGILAVAAAIPVLLLVFLIAGFVGAVGSDAADARSQLAAYDTVIAHRDIAAANIRRLTEIYDKLPYLLPGQSVSAATAALHDEFKSVLASTGGTLASAEATPAEIHDGLTQVAIRYDVTLPAGAFPQLLTGIETHMPYLFARDLKVTSGSGTGDSLTVELSVSGFARIGGKA